jgi:cobalt/nickel transport system permease protein
MHIPDGYLGPATYGTLWAAMVPIWGLASRKVKQNVKTAEVPYLAMGTVFSLMAMMFVLPIPGGTTGHISGTTLVAILLGPWSAIVAVSISLAIQALVMGDGGITAIAANCFNIAVIGSFTGSGVYRLILALRRGGEPSVTFSAVAAAIAAYLAMNVGALSTACLLGLQPIIYGRGAGSGYFPFPLEAAIPATMLPHLTMVGVLEATVTALVLMFLLKKGVPMKGNTQKIGLLLAASLAMGISAASAHDYWIEKKGDGYAAVYGHGDKRLDYDPASLKKVTVYNAAGKTLDFKKEVQSNAIIIRPTGTACLIMADLESGYWSKTIYGLKNLPKRKATRPIESFKAYHYSKSIVAAGEAAVKPVDGLKLDIIPLKNPFDLKAGDSLQLKVLCEGKPLAGATLEGDHQKSGVTDKDGLVKVTLKKGRQIYTVEKRDPLKNDPDADFIDTTTTLTFEVTR